MPQTKTILLFTLILLTLAGCVEDKPAPRLDGPERNERIDANKEVRKGFGADAPAAPFAPAMTPPPLFFGQRPGGDGRAIVGRWILRAYDLLYSWTFDADGTCKQAVQIPLPNHQLLLIHEAPGTYRLLPKDEIELTFQRGPNDRPVLKLKYRLSGDTLEVKEGSDWHSFKRAPR